MTHLADHGSLDGEKAHLPMAESIVSFHPLKPHDHAAGSLPGLRGLLLDPAVSLAPAPPALSHRELQILEGLRRGLGRKSIARTLGLAPGSVAGYSPSIFRKLGLGTRDPAAGG